MWYMIKAYACPFVINCQFIKFVFMRQVTLKAALYTYVAVILYVYCSYHRIDKYLKVNRNKSPSVVVE